MANTGWLIADRVFRMGIGLLVIIWLARYLGPQQFGLLNYATAFVALFGSVASLGLSSIVVRDLVREPDNANVTLGTAFILQIAGGGLAFVLAVLAILLVRPDDALVKLMVAVLGAGLAFRSGEMVKSWFESQVQSKYAAAVECTVFLVFSCVKIALVLGQASLISFVWAAFAEVVITSAALLCMYAWRGGALSAWRFQAGRAAELLKESWPLILSGLAIMVYMRIDQIMLGQMLGDEAVGIYSAAVRVSEVWYFIPMAITASVFPAIIQSKKRDERKYHLQLQKVFNLMVWLGVAVAVPMTFLAGWLIGSVFGDEYSEAGSVLALHVWAGIFVSLGVSSSNWYVSEGLQLLAFYRTLLGAIINIVANLILIPELGIYGAALGTIMAQVAAAYVFDYFNSRTRIVFRMKTRALLPLSNIFRGK